MVHGTIHDNNSLNAVCTFSFCKSWSKRRLSAKFFFIPLQSCSSRGCALSPSFQQSLRRATANDCIYGYGNSYSSSVHQPSNIAKWCDKYDVVIMHYKTCHKHVSNSVPLQCNYKGSCMLITSINALFVGFLD